LFLLNLRQVLCASPIPATEDDDRRREIEALQEKSLHDVTHELVRQVTSPNTCVREQAMHSLKVTWADGLGIVFTILFYLFHAILVNKLSVD
jgi:hypothetical protein